MIPELQLKQLENQGDHFNHQALGPSNGSLKKESSEGVCHGHHEAGLVSRLDMSATWCPATSITLAGAGINSANLGSAQSTEGALPAVLNVLSTQKEGEPRLCCHQNTKKGTTATHYSSTVQTYVLPSSGPDTVCQGYLAEYTQSWETR